MSGTTAGLNPREARKRLLVLESEVNRARLGEDCQAIMNGASWLAQQARRAGQVAAISALFLAGLAAWRKRANRRSAGRTSPLTTLLSILRIGASFWAALYSRRQ